MKFLWRTCSFPRKKNHGQGERSLTYETWRLHVKTHKTEIYIYKYVHKVSVLRNLESLPWDSCLSNYSSRARQIIIQGLIKSSFLTCHIRRLSVTVSSGPAGTERGKATTNRAQLSKMDDDKRVIVCEGREIKVSKSMISWVGMW